jgi:hypothetical protein
MCKDFILLFEFYKVSSDTGIGNSSLTLQMNNTEWTQKRLVMHQIACGSSYHASSMHGIGLLVIMPMTFGVYDIINSNSWMIRVKGTPCVFIAVRPVNAETEFIIMHVVWHQIA